MNVRVGLIDQLNALLGERGTVRDEVGLARYCRDWSGDYVGRPLAVIRPASTAEVAAAVRLCHGAGVPMVPQGGHTGLVAGAVPSAEGDEVVISLERLNQVRTVDAADFSMVAEAGCVLQDLHRAAEAQDRYFPLSLGAQGSCQIGGNIATNAGGVNVLRYGMARDLVLGLEVVLPDGRIWNGLRTLRKDNTGYDLKQLFIGAEGTLGIITAAALKLFPRPIQVQTVLLALSSVDAALDLFASARRDLSDLLSAFEMMSRPCLDLTLATMPDLREPFDQPALVTVLMEAVASGFVDLPALFERFLGEQIQAGQVLDGVIAQNQAQAARFWRLREDLVEAQHREGRHLRTDISVPISSLAGLMRTADAAMAGMRPAVRPIAYGHVGDGNVHYNVLPPRGLPPTVMEGMIKQCEEELFAIVDRFGGSISAEHGIGRLKRTHFLQRLSPIEAVLMRAVKAGLDPAGIMSPGRLLV